MATKYCLFTSTSWDEDTNWSDGAKPANGDSVYLSQSDKNLIVGLNQSGVTLAALYLRRSFTGMLGDFTTFLQIGATLLVIGEDDGLGGNGAAYAAIDLGAVASTVHGLWSPPTSPFKGVKPIRLKMNENTIKCYFRGNAVAEIAAQPGETSVLDDVRASGTSDVTLGNGLTLGDVRTENRARMTLRSASALAECFGGVLRTEGAGAVTALRCRGAGSRAYPNSTGTIGTLVIADGGTVDFSESSAPRSITNPVQMDINSHLILTPAISLGDDIAITASRASRIDVSPAA